MRRIEAVTGGGSIGYVRRLEQELGNAGERLRGGPFDVVPKIERLLQELRDRDRELEKLRAKLASGGGRDLSSEAVKVGDRWLLVGDVGVADPKTLRETVDGLRERLKPAVILLAGAEADKIAVVCAVAGEPSPGLHAGKLLGSLLDGIGGKGGGRPDLGQGGGPRPADLPAVLSAWREKIRNILTSQA